MLINKLTQLTIFIVFSILFTVTVSAATFTVDSTGDEVDLSPGNGICATSLGTCTLRAAIQEANALAGADNIHFNIPTSDAGYRDYDNPDTPSSGDSAGGDDYWRIGINTNLPVIGDGTILIIDGSTQTTNISDSNLYGPEIIVDNFFGSGFTCLYAYGPEDVRVYSISFQSCNLLVNRDVAPYGNTFYLVDSYIGIDAKGLLPRIAKSNSSQIDSGITVVRNSNTFLINNTISGINTNDNAAIRLWLGGATLRGNKIGTNPAGTVAIPNRHGIELSGDMDYVLIGGDSPSDGNVISGNIFAGVVRYENITVGSKTQHFFNNRFGTDISGVHPIPNAIGIVSVKLNNMSIRNGSDIDHMLVDVKIGEENKGNIIRFNTQYGLKLIEKSPYTIEDNDISNNGFGGILNLEILPTNENTLWEDNNFTGGNGADTTGDGIGDRNIEQAWYGLFEIHSSNYRRTDLTGTVLNFPSGTKVRTTDDPSTEVTSATAINVTCLGASGVSCPATGHTVGTLNNTYMVVPSGQTATVLNNVNNWFRITEYIYDGDGNKIDYGTFKFEQPHFASNTFTFDGNSTNNVINTGSARTIDGQNYTDRGEPWTDRPGATRNISTGDLGRFQIMEVEFVDANPIQNEEGDWIITVDSTEDIALAAGTTYFDDGSGTATGGMSKLATATLANGRTSLREAIAVANSRIGYDNIHFNIPTSDANYIAPSGNVQGYWPITIGSTLTISDDNGISIDGYTQTGSSRNTAPMGEPLNTFLTIQIKPSIVLNPMISITGDQAHITGLNVLGATDPGGSRLVFLLNGSNNSWIEGNFVSSTINGGIVGTSGLNQIGSSSSNNTFGTNGDGIGDVGERNLLIGSSSQFKVIIEGGTNNDNVIAGNYMGVDSTSRVCDTSQQGRSMVAIFTGDNNRVGTNFDGISDGEEANIMGCVNFNARGIVQLGTNATNTLIQGNYIGTNTYGDLLNNFAIPGVRDNGSPNGSLIKKNIIKNNGTFGIQLINSLTKGITFEENIITSNLLSDLRFGSSSEPTPNDPGDSDTGPNDLMNYPEIHRVTYLSGGKYKIEGILDNNVSGEGPFDIEICLSDNHSSGHGGCIETLGYFENKIEQVTGGINPYSVEVTVEGDNGTQDRIFTSLATNNNGSTSEFSQNFNTENNENFTLATYNINLTKPLNNERLTNRSPKLEWEASQDEDLKHYELYINQIFYSVTNTNSIQIPYELPYGRYQWQVVGVRENNTESGRSETRTFEVIETPEEETPESFPILEPLTEQPEREETIQDNNEEEESNQGTIQGELIRNILIVGGITGAGGVGLYWLLLLFKRRKRNSQQ